ncbi:MAG: SURF1 family protein [Actinomycetota bacterium]|nr:SURF1 family protein [Actinomycetota bacterium]
MVRTIFSPRWLLAIVVASAFAVTCVFLGRWQWGKYEDKLLRADTVATNYGAPPVPFAAVMSRLPLTERGEWTRVTVRGTYAPSDQLFVRNRVQGGSPGLDVLVPLTLATGQRVLVDRGWVQNADTAAQMPSVPASPAGTVTVQGWLRSPEPSLGRDLPQGQLASIAVSDAQGQIGGTVLPVYLVLESERTASGATPTRPTPLEPPDTDLGPNQAYAFQWWLFAAFGFVFYGYRLRVDRDDRRALASAGDSAPPTPSQPEPASSPTPELVTAGRPRKPPRPKKVRIWDEEDS